MAFGLVLGGGGVVGIAWEIGVLEALLQEQALSPTDAAVIVGTSAGSVVGTQLAAGERIERLVEAQLDTTPTARGGTAAAAPDMSAVMKIFGGMLTAEEMSTDLGKQTGKLAMEAPTGSEETWISSFESLLGITEWPAAADLRIVAMSCTKGERRVWTSADGVAVTKAVASSCAVPGLFPTVEIDGDRYTDGGAWSPSNVDVLAGEGLDQILFIGPIGTFLAGRPQVDRELDVLRAEGVRAESILPGEGFADLRTQLMNPKFRAQGLEVGRQDGKAAAAGVRSALGG